MSAAYLPSLEVLLSLAGVGQLLLCAAALAIPKVLDWKNDFRRLQPLTRRVFWVYAGYIWFTILSIGLGSTFAAGLLVEDSGLATAVCVYVALFWGARLVIQFACFGRSVYPRTPALHVVEFTLITLFVFLASVYSFAAVTSLQRMVS